MAYDAQDQRIRQRAEAMLAKEVADKAAQAERMGWDKPLDHRPIEFHLEMAKALEHEIQLGKLQVAKAKHYKSIYGHYPRYSVMGQGR